MLNFMKREWEKKTEQLHINYDVADLGFGLTNKGEKTLTIDIKSAQDIISQSQADIAKIDCEGAEINLARCAQRYLAINRILHYRDTHKSYTGKQSQKNF